MTKPIKVVVIDDNKDYLFATETFLSRNGFEVMTASNGNDGFNLVKEQRPDVVMLDVMMETLFAGLEVCKKIRSDPNLKDMPIIGISAISDELKVKYDQWPDYKYFSPDEFMDKPVDKDRLLILIAKVMKKAEERRRKPKWRKERDEKLKEEFAQG